MLNQNGTLNEVEKFTFSELQVLLMFEFMCRPTYFEIKISV